jgi:hypothetical protein
MVRGKASVAEQLKVVGERGLYLQRWVEPEGPEPVGAILNQQRSLSHPGESSWPMQLTWAGLSAEAEFDSK